MSVVDEQLAVERRHWVASLAPDEEERASAITPEPELTQVHGCGFALTRWRFPRDVSGTTSIRVELEGTPWSEEELHSLYPWF